MESGSGSGEGDDEDFTRPPITRVSFLHDTQMNVNIKMNSTMTGIAVHLYIYLYQLPLLPMYNALDFT